MHALLKHIVYLNSRINAMYKPLDYLKLLLVMNLLAAILWAGEMKTPETSKHFVKWVDPNSGVVSYVLKTRVAHYQQSFYFVNRSMTNDGRFLLFYCINPPDNNRTMGVVDFKTDQVREYTQIDGFIASPYLDVETADVYWTSRAQGLFCYSLLSDKKRKICGVPKCFPKPKYCFHQLVCHLTLNASKTKFFLDSFIDNQAICGDVNIADGNYNEWGRADFMYNHAQFSPTDDNMVFICKEYWRDSATNELQMIPTNKDGVYERLWLWKKGEKELQLIAPINGGGATHEWWGADGKSLYYCAFPEGLGPISKPGYGIARYDLETSQSTMITTHYASHGHCTADGKYFVFDHNIGDYRGCPHMVFFYNSVTNKRACIVTDNPGYNTAENPSKWHPDPHPNFVCNDKYIVSTLNIDCLMNLLVTPVKPLIKMTAK